MASCRNCHPARRLPPICWPRRSVVPFPVLGLTDFVDVFLDRRPPHGAKRFRQGVVAGRYGCQHVDVVIGPYLATDPGQGNAPRETLNDLECASRIIVVQQGRKMRMRYPNSKARPIDFALIVPAEWPINFVGLFIASWRNLLHASAHSTYGCAWEKHRIWPCKLGKGGKVSFQG